MDQMTTESEPLAQCIAMIDQMIQAGGASAEDLESLKMDLQEAMNPQSEYSEPAQDGMAGMIDKMQKGA